MTCCREADDRSSVRWQQFICPVFVLFFLPLRIFTGFFLAFMRKMRGCEVLNSGLLRCIILSYTKKFCVLFLHVFRWSEISHAFALKFVKCHFVSWAKVRLSSHQLLPLTKEQAVSNINKPNNPHFFINLPCLQSLLRNNLIISVLAIQGLKMALFLF